MMTRMRFALVALAVAMGGVVGEPVVVIRDPAALALGTEDLPRGFAPRGGKCAPEAERFAAAVREAAAAGSFEVALGEQPLAGPNGPVDLIAVAVLRGDPAALAAEVAKRRGDAANLDSRRFGNAILVLSGEDRSQRTLLAGASFGRYARLARAAADERAKAGDAPGALAALETVFELSADDPRGRALAGAIAEKADPTGKSAREHYERAVRALEKVKPAARPKGLLLEARLGLARALRAAGEPAAAEAAARVAAKDAEPGDADGAARAGYETAAALAALGRSDEAIAELERALGAAAGETARDLARRARGDAAFAGLREDARFRALLERFPAGE